MVCREVSEKRYLEYHERIKSSWAGCFSRTSALNSGMKRGRRQGGLVEVSGGGMKMGRLGWD
jgi:hypothetical protein